MLARLANYGGKIDVLWDKCASSFSSKKKVLCAEIALERRNKHEVYWKIEWCSVVLTFNSPTQFSYKNMRFIGKLIVAMFDKLIILMYKYSTTKEQMVWTKEDSNEADKAVSSSQEPLDKEERLLAVTN